MSNETRERDIYLAVAMGWQYVPPGPETAEMYGEGVHCLRDPEGRLRATLFSSSVEDLWNHVTPQFHEWESAKVKLLRWLAANDALFEAFYDEIDARYDESDCEAQFSVVSRSRFLVEAQFSVVSWSRFLLTLTPAQVAESAEKALRGMERSI